MPGVCLTVGAYPAHVDAAKVATELPAYVNKIRSHGIKVTQITGPDIKDATEAGAEVA